MAVPSLVVYWTVTVYLDGAGSSTVTSPLPVPSAARKLLRCQARLGGASSSVMVLVVLAGVPSRAVLGFASATASERL